MGWMQAWFCMWGNSGAVGLRLREEPRPYCRAAKRGVSERVRFPGASPSWGSAFPGSGPLAELGLGVPGGGPVAAMLALPRRIHDNKVVAPYRGCGRLGQRVDGGDDVVLGHAELEHDEIGRGADAEAINA